VRTGARLMTTGQIIAMIVIGLFIIIAYLGYMRSRH
jgi:hypothetical protein